MAATLSMVLLALAPATARAAAADTLDQAFAAYAQAQAASNRAERLAGFRQAERLFSAVAAGGAHNAALYTDIGTAALQAERIGPAVLAFKRALALDPSYAPARQNLLHSRKLLPAWVPRPEESGLLDSFFFWHRSMSVAYRAAAAALCFLLAALAAAVAIRWRSALARNLAVLPALAWLALVGSLAVQVREAARHEAVVVVEETVARAADSANAPPRFAQPLPGGTEVTVEEQREGWLRIRLANGGDAWVSNGSVAEVAGG